MQTLYFSYTLQTKAAAVAVVVILISLIGLCVTSYAPCNGQKCSAKSSSI